MMYGAIMMWISAALIIHAIIIGFNVIIAGLIHPIALTMSMFKKSYKDSNAKKYILAKMNLYNYDFCRIIFPSFLLSNKKEAFHELLQEKLQVEYSKDVIIDPEIINNPTVSMIKPIVDFIF